MTIRMIQEETALNTLKTAAAIASFSWFAAISAPAAVTNVPASANLQDYLDAAQPGDTLVLPAGATYTGNFVLPVKPTATGTLADYINITTAGFPVATNWIRVSPSSASSMAKIVDPGNGLPALTAPIYSHYWRLVGLEIYPATPQTYIYDLIDLGSYGTDQDDLSKVPQHFIIDRCYIHGWPNANFKRGISLQTQDTWVANSWISDFHSDFQEAQAIFGGNGPGSYHIVNNYLEGSAQNIFFGTPAFIPGLVPSNIEIRQNYLYKPLSLKPGGPGFTGYTPWIKNFIEFKNGQDVVIDGNLMENNWVQGPLDQIQLGHAIVLGPRTDGGSDLTVAVQRITITNNVIRHVGGVFDAFDYDSPAQYTPTNTITFRNNIVDDIRNDYSYIGSLVIEIQGVNNVTIDHNDLFYPAGISYLVTTKPVTGFVMTNNIFPFGIGLNSPCGWKSDAFGCAFPGSVVNDNAAVGAILDWMPAGTLEPATMNDMGFVNLGAGASDYHNYALSPSSPYATSATDGTAVGASVTAIDQALGTTSLR